MSTILSSRISLVIQVFFNDFYRIFEFSPETCHSLVRIIPRFITVYIIISGFKKLMFLNCLLVSKNEINFHISIL